MIDYRPSADKMFPALDSKAGKHRGVQRHILSFLPPLHRRVARSVFRECPPAEAQPGMRVAARELAASTETHALLRYEVEKNGLEVYSAVDQLFEDSAPADEIVWAMARCDDAHAWEQSICRFNRLDVFERLNLQYYMWDEQFLCEEAWHHDCSEIIGWLHYVRQKPAAFLWSGYNHYAARFPLRVTLALVRSRVFPSTQATTRMFESVIGGLVQGTFETSSPGFYRRLWSFIENCSGEVYWEPNSDFKRSSAYADLQRQALEDSRRGRFCQNVVNFLLEEGLEDEDDEM